MCDEPSLRLIDVLCANLILLQVLDFGTTPVDQLRIRIRSELFDAEGDGQELPFGVRPEDGRHDMLVAVVSLWVRDGLRLPLRGVLADLSLKLERALRLDKLESKSKRTLALHLMLFCNLYISW